MKSNIIQLDVDHVGSQDPADQPTEEDFAAISAYLKARRAENEALLEAYRQEIAEAASLKAMQEAGQTV